MTTTDHLDGEIRRALQEIGDAAGVPPTFADLGTFDVGPRRRAPRWGVAAAVAAAAAVIGVVIVARPDGASSPTGPIGTDAGSVPVPVDTTSPPTAPVECGAAACPDGAGAGLAPVPTDQEQALLDLVVPALPDGFRAVYASTRPTARVVAYDRNFVRVDLSISLGSGAQVTTDQGPDGLGPGGPGAGLTVVTALDDVVSALTSSAPNDSESPPAEVEQAAAAMVAEVAAALDAPTRERLQGGTPTVVGAADLDERIGDVVEGRTGWTVTGGGGGSAGELVTWVTPRESGVGAGTIAVNAFRTALRLPDGATRTDLHRVTATRWIAGWQVIVTAFATEDDPAPVSEDELESLLDAVSPVFIEWRPAVVTAPVCDSYTFRPTDDAFVIAERFGLTLDDIIEVNPDITDSAIPGDQIALPCGAVEQTRATDATGLGAFTSQPVLPGETFEPGSSVTVASDRSVWILTGGTNSATGEGAVRVERFDRATGAVLAGRPFAGALGITPCAGPIELLDDPAAPLDAIPARCAADGRTGTVDVWSARLAGFAG